MADEDKPIASLVERQGMAPDGEIVEELEIEALISDVPMDMPEDIEIIEEDDGGVTLDFDPMSTARESENFYDNLAEDMDDRELGSIAGDLLSEYESNKASRSDWEEAYSKGLELLGFKYEDRTEPFRGATGVTHPILAEAAVQFQAQAFNELLPPSGPVRTVVLGAPTHAKEDQAVRVRDFMNYYITDVMEEYTPEFDQMLFYLPLAGSTFKKVYYDEGLDRAVCKFIPAENLIVPYEANDLETCPNITHVVRMSLNDLRKKQLSGFYRDIPVIPAQDDTDSVSAEMDSINGTQPSNIDYDCTLLECHVDLDLPGFEETDEDGEATGIKIPYIVTVSEDNGQVLSIRRNYREEDELKRKIQYFIHYKFLPGFGFYGLGLIHTIGGLSRTATAALRQLIDAGTLSNLPAGFKARGLRIRDDNEPLQPGEFRDVDAPGGAIRDSLMALPFKGPDQTLFQLLGFVVDAAQRFATITDLKVGDGNQNAPVGTTIAMLEQGTRVMSAIHKRLHYAMRVEFKLLSKVMSDYLPEEYPYSVAGADQSVKRMDFDNRVDIMPVSNPNTFSQAQRIAVAQTEMQLAMQAPEIHNIPEVYRRMYEALGVRDVDKILVSHTTDKAEPRDPAQENIDSMEGVPLKVFKGQDHQAHITAHLIFGSSPMIAQMPKLAMDLQKHIMEHVKIQAEEKAEAAMQQQQMAPQQQPLNGIQQAAPQNMMPPQTMANGGEVEPPRSMEFEALKAQFIAQGMQEVKALSQQLAGGGQEKPDPLIGLKQQELAIKEQQVQGNLSNDQQELKFDRERLGQRSTEFQQRIASQERQTAARIQAAQEREMMKQRNQ
jgi:hypothetical protein|tara:strand:+ start:850 stop:3345 length:2496 start_codon:yes stop_codon:yes gene_type:complete